MIKLEKVKIYKNDHDDYDLIPSDVLDYKDIVPHNELKKWAVLYAFSNPAMTNLFLYSLRTFSDSSICYFRVDRKKNGSAVVLVVNKDAEGGIQDYEDWQGAR